MNTQLAIPTLPIIISDAIFNDMRTHRYLLRRIWDEEREMICFIGLNPSTANEDENDPTIKSCMRIARNQNAGGIYMVNLFSYITAYPDVLVANFNDAVNPKTNLYIDSSFRACHKIICAWGRWPFAHTRKKEIEHLIAEDPYFENRVYCLGKNQDGSPKHPLYIKSDIELINYFS